MPYKEDQVKKNSNNGQDVVKVPYSVNDYLKMHRKRNNESKNNLTEALFRGKGLEKHLEHKITKDKNFIKSTSLYMTISIITFAALAVLVLKICCCDAWCEDPMDAKLTYRMSMDGFTRDAEAVSLYEGGVIRKNNSSSS